MKEGRHKDDYFILFEEEVIQEKSKEYSVDDYLPGHVIVGLIGWDDFLVKDRQGKMFRVPTVPMAEEYKEPIELNEQIIVLEEDERSKGKIKWYVTPIVFGGDPLSPCFCAKIWYQTYKRAYFTDPPPEPRYRFSGSFGVTLYFQDFEAAVSYYTQILGPLGYVEGEGTRGWAIGGGWLTLLQGKSGNPRNVEITIAMATPEQAEKLQRAFIEAGGRGGAPSDQLMYVPIRSCPVVDPFGMEILIVSPLDQEPAEK